MVMGSLPEAVDIAVIGGGVGGYFAAIHAAQIGKSVALIEKEKLGGHCLNYACIPSKTMIKVADMFYEIQHAENFGIHVGEIHVEPTELYKWRMDASDKLEKGVDFLCKSNGVEVAKGSAMFTSSSSLQIGGGGSIDFKKAIIATGSDPTVLKGFEFDHRRIIDYKEALMLDYLPETIAILGAGYVAVEIGMLYAKLGSKVSIVARSDVLRLFDRDAVEVVKKKMDELGIKIFTGATPVSYDASSVTLSDGKRVFSQLIVVAVGLSPYTQGLGLENTQVKLDDKGFVKVDNALRTTDPGILAVGDVIGEPLLAHKAMRQGIVAAEVAAGQNAAYDNMVVPAVIFSDPEIAIAGRIDGDDLKVTKFPLTALGRAIALNATNGFVKIAADSDNIVRGVEVVSDDAGDIIGEAVVAIEMGATLEDIADSIHPHPTYSEALQEAAEAALGRSIHYFYGK
ncbi:MAG: dihydrolipoyl dehydrogenase [Candidatus Micrarchaeota archaeon]|nr:dihydrolipoyl dehydrogenase [Candidatus Micrarchaeota archaeon]